MMSRTGVWWKVAVSGAALLAATRMDAQVTTTTVQGTVYRADGTVAQGTMLVSWPAFVTANNQAVAAGTTTVVLDSSGFASVNLAANAGANPAGTYYTVVYHLTGGGAGTTATSSSVSTEYWTVPASATATIASVRAKLEPANVAVQSVSKAYVDQLVAAITPTAGNYLSLAGGYAGRTVESAGGPGSECAGGDEALCRCAGGNDIAAGWRDCNWNRAGGRCD
jgi:hypothetical protein